jgi:hypothetical protein
MDSIKRLLNFAKGSKTVATGQFLLTKDDNSDYEGADAATN